MKKTILLFFIFAGSILSQVKFDNNISLIDLSNKDHKLASKIGHEAKDRFEKNRKLNLLNNQFSKTILNKSTISNGYVFDYVIMEWNSDNSQWINSEHYTNTYDDQFNELESIYQIWGGSSGWVNSEKYTSEYDENGNWISYLAENWNIHNWYKYFLYTTSYNSQNLITEDLLQIWNQNSTKWENYILYTYLYDENWNNINYMRQDWDFTNLTWLNIWQHIGQYQNNLLMEDLLQQWTDNSWLNYSLTDYEYDGNKNLVNQLIQVWQDNSSWAKTSDHIFAYDENNNNIEYYYNVWDDSLSDWVTWYRDLYYYDGNNNQTGYLSEDWNNADSTWINYEQAFFTYDENGNPKNELYQSWDSGISDWVNSTNVDYTVSFITSIADAGNLSKNNSFGLEQNYPNPFNPTTTISYSIPDLGNVNFNSTINVKLIVYDILGRKISTLVNENKHPGNYVVNFDASKFNSGIYFYKLDSGNFHEIKKMIFLK